MEFTCRCHPSFTVPRIVTLFRYLPPRDENSSIEVGEACSHHGMHLAMLKTPAEWEDIMGQLQSDYNPFPESHMIRIGLFPSSPTKPPMYVHKKSTIKTHKRLKMNARCFNID